MFPVGGHLYTKNDFYQIDLSATNDALQELNAQTELMDYIKAQVQQADRLVAYGGYGEERDFYLKSPLFSGERRTRHLGIDIWLPVGHPVFAVVPAKVYGKAYNDLFLDYGYTVILEHSLNGESIYSLYGHLSNQDFATLMIGDTLNPGDVVGYIGDESQNGGWAPHLHFQLIKDLEGNQSDYPGVCHTSDREKYMKNCPDPINWIIVE